MKLQRYQLNCTGCSMDLGRVLPKQIKVCPNCRELSAYVSQYDEIRQKAQAAYQNSQRKLEAITSVN